MIRADKGGVVCCILDENRISINTESCLSMHTFDRTYTFHRLLIDPEECLQGGSFQHFHDPYFKNGCYISIFSNLMENMN